MFPPFRSRGTLCCYVQQNCRNAANSNIVIVKLCEPMNDPGVMLLKNEMNGLVHSVTGT
jgi:hypothetical protein